MSIIKWWISTQGNTQRLDEERQIHLSFDQAYWIMEILLDMFYHFGGTRRKQTRIFGHIVVSLIEGSNWKRCFVSIQIQLEMKDTNFVIVLVGIRGK